MDIFRTFVKVSKKAYCIASLNKERIVDLKKQSAVTCTINGFSDSSLSQKPGVRSWKSEFRGLNRLMNINYS